MSQLNLKLRQIQAFVAVARYQQFTLAAQSMCITQPALSALVRELEIELKITLFDRTTRMVRLTSAGETFLPVAERVLADLDSIVSASHDLADLRQGHVAVACSTVMAATELPAMIGEFASKFPGIRISIRDAIEQDLADLVVRGVADLAIATEVEPDAQIDQLRVSEDELSLFLRCDHDLARRPKVRWAELAEQPHITLPRVSPLRRLVDQTAGRLGVFFKARFEVGFASTALALVEAGYGVAILPNNALLFYPSKMIRAIALVAPVVKRQICLLTSTQRSLSPAATCFRFFATEWLSKNVSSRKRVRGQPLP